MIDDNLISLNFSKAAEIRNNKNTKHVISCSDGWLDLYELEGKYYLIDAPLQEHEGFVRASEVKAFTQEFLESIGLDHFYVEY